MLLFHTHVKGSCFFLIVIPYTDINQRNQNDEDRQAESMLLHIDHIMSQHHFHSRGWQLADETAQGVGAEMHAGKGRNSRDQTIGHIGNGSGSRHGLPGIIGIQFFQRFTLIDNIHSHAPEKSTHDIERNKDSHRFRQPGNDNTPEKAENQSIRRGNKNGWKKSDDIDDHINEKAHEGSINTKAVQVRNGASQISILDK